MVDPVSAAALGAAAGAVSRAAQSATDEGARVAGNLISRLLGPSADVLGANWAEQLRERNMQRLLSKTEKRARRREELGYSAGVANARVASQVFESAQYADSEVVSEYLSGVLASSRSATGAGDAGVAWSAVISRLSSDQLAMHYLIYASARPIVMSKGEKRANSTHRLEVILPLLEVLQSLEMIDAEGDLKMARFSDALDGLMREGLLEEGYSYGDAAHTFESELASGQTMATPLEYAMRVHLSIHGMRLFVWGNGAGELGIDAYVDPDVLLQAVDDETAPTPLPTYTVETIMSRPTTAQA